jgi:hypothetical protein
LKFAVVVIVVVQAFAVVVTIVAIDVLDAAVAVYGDVNGHVGVCVTAVLVIVMVLLLLYWW